MNTFKSSPLRHAQRGFSIIEALISGLVLSFGMMALVGVQVSLSRNGDVAKQRTEATRLAQQKMEELRAFQSDVTLVGTTSFETLQENPEAAFAVLSTTFTRTWNVSAVTAEPERRISVNVTWPDRTGEIQAVRLNSVITRANYARVGVMMSNSRNADFAGIRQNRDGNVPFPALDIGNGRSTYQWPTTSNWYVFSNTDASVLYRCSTQPTSATALDTACTAVRGYVVAGYVSSASSNGANANIDSVLSPWSINACSIASSTNIGQAVCFVSNVIIPVNGSPIINPSCPYLATGATAPTGTELTRLSFFKCYAALVELANSNDPGWGGRLTFETAPWDSRRICRFNHNLVNSNGFYVNVEQSLNNENYFARLTPFGHHQSCETGQTRHQPQY